jgi:DNA polymerase I-like protein with 3'-5' exonuclease and polymerase domains
MNWFVKPPETEWVMPTEIPDLSGATTICIDLETYDPDLKTKGSGWPTKNGHVVGFAVAVDGLSVYLPIRHGMGDNLPRTMVIEYMKDLCSNPDAVYVFHNASYDVGWLRAEGIEVKGRIVDTMVAAPLIDENRFSYSLNNLGRDYLFEKKDERMLRDAAKEFGLDPKAELHKLPAMYVGKYAEQDAALTLRLWHHFKGMIENDSLEDIFNLELDVLKITIEMRSRGVRIDLEGAENAGKLLTKQEKTILSAIKKEYGVDVDIWAAASVAKAFDKVGLEYPRTAKGAPSFTKDFLRTHAHPMAQSIVKAREFNKAHSTFIETILRHQHNGRVHPDIHSLRSDDGGTVTGRFCVHGDTVLELDTGPVKIGDYNPTGKEKILTHKGRWQRVLRRIYKGEEEMYCLRVSSGDSIKCTGNHRVLTSDGWVSVRDLAVGSSLLHVNFKEFSSGRTDVPESGRDVFVGGKTDDIGSCQENGSDTAQRYGSNPKASDSGTVGGRAGAEILPLEVRGKQPNEGEDKGTSPQLQGGFALRSGWVRSCVKTGLVYWKNVKARVQTFRGYVRASWDTWYSGWNARTSHRWGQNKQRPVQSGLGDISWSSPFTRTVTVEAIEPMGIAQVWDIEVETDHSYVAHGLIHHNSYSSPNLQQIPSRDENISSMIRSLFLPEEGDRWGSFDYSSQEPRLVVHYAHGLKIYGAEQFVEAFNEDPRTDFHQLAADLMGVSRKEAKTIGLGLIYGMGVNKLSHQLGVSVDEARDISRLYHAKVPFLRELSNRCMDRAANSPYFVRTILHRRCRFPLWEPKSVTNSDSPRTPYDRIKAAEVYGENNIKVAFTYKALNRVIQGSAADQTKKAMVELYKEGLLPLIQIHDELAMSVPDKATADKVEKIMQECVQLHVPSVVDAEFGPNWGKLKTGW